MYKYFTCFLIICFLINICGCYTNNRILKDDYSNIISDKDKELHIKLKDGRTIISTSYEHIAVKEPSEFILGRANIIDGGSLKVDVGTILFKTQIDSMDTNNSAGKIIVCYSGGKRYYFIDENYFYITKDTDPGLWVIGKIAETGNSYYGKLDPEEISSIDVKELNTVKTALFVSEITLIGLLVVGLIIISSNPPLKNFHLKLY